MWCIFILACRHYDLTIRQKYLTSRHKDLTSRHNYLKSDDRNMPLYKIMWFPVAYSTKERHGSIIVTLRIILFTFQFVFLNCIMLLVKIIWSCMCIQLVIKVMILFELTFFNDLIGILFICPLKNEDLFFLEMLELLDVFPLLIVARLFLTGYVLNKVMLYFKKSVFTTCRHITGVSHCFISMFCYYSVFADGWRSKN